MGHVQGGAACSTGREAGSPCNTPTAPPTGLQPLYPPPSDRPPNPATHSLESLPMDLSNLDITAATASVKKICTVEINGALEPEDIAQALMRGRQIEESGQLSAAISSEPEDPKDIKRLREKHHHVARLIAGGMTQRMAADLAGFSESYLSVLLGAPAMQELLAHYRNKITAGHEILYERLRGVGGKAIEELEERLTKSPEDFDVFSLISAAKLGLDRTGHGPSSSTHTIEEKHIFDQAELRKLDQAARRESSDRILPAPVKVIEHSSSAETRSDG